MSKTTIDVRGMGCPEPLLVFTEVVKKAGATEMETSFDCAAASMRWTVTAVTNVQGYAIMNRTRIS